MRSGGVNCGRVVDFVSDGVLMFHSISVKFVANQRIKGLVFLAFIMLLPFVSSCNRVQEKEEAIKGIIIKYDDALMDAYRRLTIRPIEKVASEMEVSKNNAILLDFFQDKISMDSKLVDIKFRSIKFESETRAEARVTEKWVWRHIHIETKQEVKPWKEEEQRLLYRLVKDPKKGWIIDSVELTKGD